MRIPITQIGLFTLLEAYTASVDPVTGMPKQSPMPTGMMLSPMGVPLVNQVPVTDLLWGVLISDTDDIQKEALDDIMGTITSVVGVQEYFTPSGLDYLTAATIHAALKITCEKRDMPYQKDPSPEYDDHMRREKIYRAAMAILDMQKSYARPRTSEGGYDYQSPGVELYLW